MTRQDYIKKWFSYGVTLVLVAVLQGLVFTRLRAFGLIPMLLPLALVALATLEGPVSGAGFGIAVGIVSMYVDGGSAWVIVLACLGGLAVGLIARYVLRQDFIGHLICSVGLLVLRMAWCVIPRWIEGVAELSVLLRVGIGELLWTLMFTPVIYLMFRFVYRRWGSAYYA